MWLKASFKDSKKFWFSLLLFSFEELGFFRNIAKPAAMIKTKVKILNTEFHVVNLNKVLDINGYTNIPTLAKAVTIPATFARWWLGKCFATVGTTIGAAAPPNPIPTNNPKLIWKNNPELLKLEIKKIPVA